MANDSEHQSLPWWRKALARGLGILAAVVCFICGILTCALIIVPIYVVAGVFMIISIIPIAMCQEASIVVGFVFTVIVGLVYIFMSFRKQDPKPSRNAGDGRGNDFSEA